MYQQYIIPGLLLVLGLVVLLVVGAVAWRAYLVRLGKHPMLVKIIDEAIVLVYKLSEAVVDETDKRLHSIAKKEVIAALYTILPDYKILGRNWKAWISKDQFVTFVQARFDELMVGYHTVSNAILQELLEQVRD